MIDSGFTFFATPLGPVGIAWRGDALAALHLPGDGSSGDEAEIRTRFRGLQRAPAPLWVETAIARIRALLAGAPSDLADLPLDFASVGAFEAAVYRAAQSVPPGSTLTYGELAERIGDRGAARAVGQALGRNPWPIVVPCHRITAAAGKLGGFSAPGGSLTKRRLLELEGAFRADTLPLFASPEG